MFHWRVFVHKAGLIKSYLKLIIWDLKVVFNFKNIARAQLQIVLIFVRFQKKNHIVFFNISREDNDDSAGKTCSNAGAQWGQIISE